MIVFATDVSRVLIGIVFSFLILSLDDTNLSSEVLIVTAISTIGMMILRLGGDNLLVARVASNKSTLSFIEFVAVFCVYLVPVTIIEILYFQILFEGFTLYSVFVVGLNFLGVFRYFEFYARGKRNSFFLFIARIIHVICFSLVFYIWSKNGLADKDAMLLFFCLDQIAFSGALFVLYFVAYPCLVFSKSLSTTTMKLYLKESFIILTANIASISVTKMPVLILGFYAVPERIYQVGAMFRFVDMVLIAPNLFTTSMFPLLSNAYRKGYRRIVCVSRKVFMLSALFMLISVLLIYVLVDILSLLDGFVFSIESLMLLTMLGFLTALGSLTTRLLVLKGLYSNIRQRSFVVLIAMLIYCSADYVFDIGFSYLLPLIFAHFFNNIVYDFFKRVSMLVSIVKFSKLFGCKYI
ncbi:MAG: hypothetical protein JXR18_12240 [Neptuniibacter sp.]